MPDPWTIRRVVTWSTEDFASRAIASARLDAELLVAHALGIDRIRLYMDLDRPLAAPELAAIRELVARRRKHEPIAYIVGKREFYGHPFEVGPAVLVPRPETELVVERALERLGLEEPVRVLDLCTGSGAIAISIALARPVAQVDATDLSADALTVAARNVAAHALTERVHLYAGDLFAAVPADARYHVVTANPPYISEPDLVGLPPDVRDFEPRVALSGGADGLDLVRRIVAGAARVLVPGGTLVMEVGKGQAPAVVALLATAGWSDARAHVDLARVERVVEAVHA